MGRNGKPTRDKILAKSRELIFENGFAGTSIDLILERTQLTKGAFFYHFKTKADLALEVVNEFANTDLQELDLALEQTETYVEDPRERLLQFIQRFIDMFSGVEEPPSCLYASVSNEQNQYSEEIKQIVRKTLLKWRQAFGIMIEEAAKQNPPTIPWDKDSLSDHFTVVMEGAFTMSKALQDPSVTFKQLTHLKHYFELLFPPIEK